VNTRFINYNNDNFLTAYLQVENILLSNFFMLFVFYQYWNFMIVFLFLFIDTNDASSCKYIMY